MLPKYFPVILVAHNKSGPRFKTVYNADEHAAFCSKFVGPDTKLETIKTLEALGMEILSEERAWARVRKYLNEKDS